MVCGCTLMDGRCADHAAKMALVHAAWFHGDDSLVDIVESNCDGFGAGLGSLGDWSGIRDSSPAAVDSMFAGIEQVLDDKFSVLA